MKSKERIKLTGEVFTPSKLVNEIANKLLEIQQTNQDIKNEDDFIDPACGSGNLLMGILKRKLSHGYSPLETLKSIYGCDIMQDNIKSCRYKLLKIISKKEEITKEHVKTVLRNIKWLNPNNYPKGSLDYDFKFQNKLKKSDVNLFFKNFKKWEKNRGC